MYVDIRAKSWNLEKFAVSLSLYILGTDMSRTKCAHSTCIFLLKQYYCKS